MKPRHTSSTPDSSPPQPRALRLAALRIVWVVLCLFSTAILVFGLPTYYTYLQTICRSPSCSSGELATAQVQALGRLGISVSGYATAFVLLSAVFGACWLAISVLLFWRGSGNWMTIFAALTLVTFGLVRFPDAPTALAAAHPAWWLPIEGMRFFGSACLSVFCYIFPDGKFVPRWTALVAFLWILPQVGEFFWPTSPLSPGQYPALLQAAGFLGFVLSVVVAQIYRYRNVSTSAERQQTKWVILGLGAALTGFLLLTFVLPLVVPANAEPLLVSTYIQAGTYGVMLLLPLSLAIAILRHRLYDIDLLINLTLVYGLLTATLTLIYVAGTIGLQLLFQTINKSAHQPAVVIVASTLLIAALFRPLRRRIQALIDRRFYRQRYNATKILEQFAEDLQSEVDLSTITDQILTVVHGTMQPVQVSLWLRPQLEQPGRAETPSP
jgi:hypothetical protein